MSAPVYIADTWQPTPEGYTATGTKGEAITLRRAHSPSRRTKRWYLTVTPVDGDAKAVEIGPRTTFDHAEGALLNWSTP